MLIWIIGEKIFLIAFPLLSSPSPSLSSYLSPFNSTWFDLPCWTTPFFSASLFLSLVLFAHSLHHFFPLFARDSNDWQCLHLFWKRGGKGSKEFLERKQMEREREKESESNRESLMPWWMMWWTIPPLSFFPSLLFLSVIQPFPHYERKKNEWEREKERRKSEWVSLSSH